MSIWERLGDALKRDVGGSVKSWFSTLTGEKDPAAADEGEAGPQGNGRSDEGADQLTFTIGVIALGAKMAKADGVVTRDEVDAFKEVFIVPPGEEANVRRVFNLARQDVAGFESYAQKIAKIFSDRHEVLGDVLDGLFHIAKADEVIHPKEMEFLERVAEIFGFEGAEFERIRCTHMMCEGTDPYSVLGVNHSIDDKALKSAYRSLVRENHPDSLIARGVPEEFISMATDKLAAINSAYEQIARERGLT